MKRFVSVWLPNWPIERLKRQSPGVVQDDKPYALVKSTPRGIRVAAVNGRAHEDGIRPGEALADVRARLPDLISRPADETADGVALIGLARWCGRYGPSRNIEGSDGVWIDITGVAHLFGGESGLIGDLERRLRGFGLTPRIGLADTLGAAFALARAPQDTLNRLAQAGATKAALGVLPVELLRIGYDQVLTLRRLGLKSIGQLYDLPRAALARRFPEANGAEAVLKRLDQALGLRAEPFRPLAPRPVHSVQQTYADPLLTAAGVEAETERLALALCLVLDEAGQGARRLRLDVYKVDGGTSQICIGTSRPCREPRHILRLLEDKLAGIDAGFGIDGLQLAVLAMEPLASTQISLCGGRQGGAGEGVDLLVDRLANRLGSSRIFRLESRASHIPERVQRCAPVLASVTKPAALAPARLPALSAASLACPAALPYPRLRPPLLFTPPEPVAVLAEVPEGAPIRFKWRRVLRRIVKAEGPERIEPEWWQRLGGSVKAEPVRDYYRIEDEAGQRYWVFRAGLYASGGEPLQAEPPRWYLHGLFG